MKSVVTIIILAAFSAGIIFIIYYHPLGSFIPTPAAKDTGVVINVSLYPLRSAPDNNTTESNEQILAAFARAQEILKPLGITFQSEIRTPEISSIELNSIANADPARVMPDKSIHQLFSAFNLVLVNKISKGEGATSINRVALVADAPTENQAKIMAHEIGHLLGLAHASGADQLMHPIVTGTRLSASELSQVLSNLKKLDLELTREGLVICEKDDDCVLVKHVYCCESTEAINRKYLTEYNQRLDLQTDECLPVDSPDLNGGCPDVQVPFNKTLCIDYGCTPGYQW